MATTFKTAAANTTTSAVALLTAPAGTNCEMKFMNLANNSASVSATVTVAFYDASSATSFIFINGVTVPASSTMKLDVKGLTLEPGDRIQIQHSGAQSAAVIVSYAEMI